MRYKDINGIQVTVYEANHSDGGLLWGLKQAKTDIYESRYIIIRLFWRDFIAQFRQKIFGYFWSLIGPLLGIINFVFLSFIGVLKPGEGEIPYTAYVLTGSAVWSCLPGSMGAVAAGLQSQADLILRTRVPKIALAVSSLSAIVYSSIIGIVPIGIVLLVLEITPSWWILMYPLLVLPMILIGSAIGLILSVMGAVAKDLTQIVTQVLSILMYLTPVIYVQATIANPLVQKIIKWNPLTYLVDIPRSLICLGRSDQVNVYMMVIIIIFICVTFAIRIFYLLEDLVAERL